MQEGLVGDVAKNAVETFSLADSSSQPELSYSLLFGFTICILDSL